MPHGSRVVALVLILLGACGGETDEPPPPPPPPPDLPALGTIEPYDWSEIDPEESLKLEAPNEAPGELLWDFSEGKRYSYEFTQSLSQILIQTIGERRIRRESSDRNRGQFVFAAGSGRRAKAEITIKTEEATVGGRPIPEEILKKNKPTKFKCSVREDGAAEVTQQTGQADARFFFDALLALKLGERKVKDGSVSTRSTGAFKVGPYECVRLETDFELAPETVSGKSIIRGRTVAYFALRERRFVRASTAMSTRIATRALRKGGIWVVTEIKTETTQRLKLRERR